MTNFELNNLTNEELGKLVFEASTILGERAAALVPKHQKEAKVESKTEEKPLSDRFNLLLEARSFKGSEKAWLARLDYNEKHGTVRNRYFIEADSVDKDQISARSWKLRKSFVVDLEAGDWLEYCEAGSAKHDIRNIIKYVGDGKFEDEKGTEIDTDFERI